MRANYKGSCTIGAVALLMNVDNWKRKKKRKKKRERNIHIYKGHKDKIEVIKLKSLVQFCQMYYDNVVIMVAPPINYKLINLRAL
jgi:hypothetical protein